MSAEILIIDDNPDIRNIIRDLISESGYKTRVAANYNQALTEIDKKMPDVAILDVNFHHRNGMQDIFYNRDNVLFVSLHGDPMDAFPIIWGTRKKQGRAPDEDTH